MGKNPSIIFRELYKKAKHRDSITSSVNGSSGPYDMGKQDGCYYVTEKEVIKNFLIEGYSEQKAERHIDQWIEYDIVFVRYKDGYKYIGFNKDVML